MFRLSNVSKKYVSQGIETCAINGITMELDKKIIAIVGRSGSGKTTLLNLLSTNDDATEGEIYYNDMNLVQINDKEKELLRLNRFGFVFQQFELIQSLNVHDNIVLPAVFAKKKMDKDFYQYLLKVLEIYELDKKMPYQLSGGQQQRVSIARALLGKPEVIFADEPTGSLDRATGENVMNLLISLQKEINSTFIYVTHNEEIAGMAETVVKLEDGRICE